MSSGIFVSEQSLRRLLVKLAAIGDSARNKLERKAVRQAMGPAQRLAKQKWKGLSSQRGGTVRRDIAKAVQIRVGSVLTPQLTRFGIKTKGSRRNRMAGNVHVSYKRKFRNATVAHLIESGANVAGPATKKTRKMPNRKVGRTKGRFVMRKVFSTASPKMRKAFIFAMQEFLAQQKAKDIRKTIKGALG